MKIIAMVVHIMDTEFMAGGPSMKYFTFSHEIKFISLMGNKKDSISPWLGFMDWKLE